MSDSKSTENKRGETMNRGSLSDFLRELDERVWEYERETRRTLDRQIELEQCVYTLLSGKKPTLDNYQSVCKRLDGIKDHLRNPALYELSKKRAGHE